MSQDSLKIKESNSAMKLPVKLGRVLQTDNFRKMKGYGWPGLKRLNLWRQDKGQQACAKAFLDAIEQGAPCPIPAEQIFEVARVSIEVAEGLRGQ